MRVLGFNAVRLPMRFTEFDLNPLIIKHPCQVAPAVRAHASLVLRTRMQTCRCTLTSLLDLCGGGLDTHSEFFIDSGAVRSTCWRLTLIAPLACWRS